MENKRLKQLLLLFAGVALLSVIGLIAGIVVAVRQSNKATRAEQTTREPVVTTVYYFNDDRLPPTEAPGNGIVDPIDVIGDDDDVIPVNDNGSFVLTAEDLGFAPEQEPEPIVDRIPVNDPIVIDVPP